MDVYKHLSVFDKEMMFCFPYKGPVCSTVQRTPLVRLSFWIFFCGGNIVLAVIEPVMCLGFVYVCAVRMLACYSHPACLGHCYTDAVIEPVTCSE